MTRRLGGCGGWGGVGGVRGWFCVERREARGGSQTGPPSNCDMLNERCAKDLAVLGKMASRDGESHSLPGQDFTTPKELETLRKASEESALTYNEAGRGG